MKRKNWIALLVSAVLTLSLASCAAAPAPASGGAAAAPDAAAGTEAAAEEVSELPPVTLKIYFEGSNVTDDKPVMEATPPTDEYMNRLLAIMEEYGLPAQIH